MYSASVIIRTHGVKWEAGVSGSRVYLLFCVGVTRPYERSPSWRWTVAIIPSILHSNKSWTEETLTHTALNIDESNKSLDSHKHISIRADKLLYQNSVCAECIENLIYKDLWALFSFAICTNKSFKKKLYRLPNAYEWRLVCWYSGKLSFVSIINH